MSSRINGKTYYRSGEVCKLTGISKNTLFRWMKQDIFRSMGYRDRRGWRLFDEQDLELLRAEANKLMIREQ